MDKKAVVHLHNGILLGCKTEEGNLTFYNSMDGPGEHCAKLNKPEKASTIQFHLHVEANEQNKQKGNRLRYREQTDSCQSGWGWG